MAAYDGYKTEKVLIGEKAQRFSISIIKKFLSEKDKFTEKQGQNAEIEVGEKSKYFGPLMKSIIQVHF